MGYPETMRDILELERKEELKNKKETLENHPAAGDIEDIAASASVVECNHFENADKSVKSDNILSQNKQASKKK